MKPKAVLISDVHYNLNTLALADAAVNQAIDKANSLNVPLIVAGDLHDSKANLRGECIAAMTTTFKRCKIKPYILVGNHCKINEKSDKHSLVFLEPFANIINDKEYNAALDLYMIAYQSDLDAMKSYLKTLPKGTTIIMHQGLKKANAGEYTQDKSALDTFDVAKFRVISGHYHTRQTIELSQGVFDFIGNPYTLTWAEAGDPDKGYQILNDDNTLTFVPTCLRRHIKVTWDAASPAPRLTARPEDLVWAKVQGTRDQLKGLTKAKVQNKLGVSGAFKVDFILTDKVTNAFNFVGRSPESLLDSMIEGLDRSLEDKNTLKALWREVAEQ